MTLHRGDIYFVTLAGNMGSEQAGRRPVLIVSADAINALPLTVVVIPGTDAANQERDFMSTVRVPARETGLGSWACRLRPANPSTPPYHSRLHSARETRSGR